MDSTAQLAAKFEKHYVNISRQFGYEINPPEQLINMLAYECLNNKHFSKAENLFKLNVANYQESFNVFDSYGDYWLTRKDTVNAIKYFEKALTKEENTFSRQKLEELQGLDQPVLNAEILTRYTGEYEFKSMTVKTFVRDGKLLMSVPGQPEYELVPMKEHEFKIKSLTGYNIRFEMDGDNVIAAYSIQPDDTLKGSVKRKG